MCKVEEIVWFLLATYGAVVVSMKNNTNQSKVLAHRAINDTNTTSYVASKDKSANARIPPYGLDIMEQDVDLGIPNDEQMRRKRKIEPVNFFNMFPKENNGKNPIKFTRLKFLKSKKYGKYYVNRHVERQIKRQAAERQSKCFVGQVQWKNGLCMPCSLYYEMADGTICTSQVFRDGCFTKWHEECDVM